MSAVEHEPLGPDQFGISERVFGPLDPDLPSLIGRVVMLSALIESKLEQLADALGTDPTKSASGMQVSQVIGLIRDRLTLYRRDEREDRFAADAELALTHADAVLQQRNQIVHRVWAVAGVGVWRGYKPHRPVGGAVVGLNAAWRDYTHRDFVSLIREAEDAVHKVQTQSVASAAFARPAERLDSAAPEILTSHPDPALG